MVKRLFYTLLLVLLLYSNAFAGINGWADANYLSRSSAIVSSTPILISVWGYDPTGFAGADPAVTISPVGTGDNFLGMLYLSAGQIRAQTRVLPTTSNGTAGTASTSTWFHATGQMIGAASRFAALNGTEGSEATTSLSPSGTFGISIGRAQSVGFADSDTTFAEVSIWECCASAANAHSLDQKLADGENPLNINTEVGQPWSGTLASYYPARNDETMLTDYSGNGNTLTQHGTITTSTDAAHPEIEIYPSTLDAFAGTNGDNLDSYNPTWIQIGDTMEVQSSAATIETGGTDGNVIWNGPMSDADGKVCADVTAIGAGTSPYFGVSGRLTTLVAGTYDGYGVNVDLVSGAGNETITLYSILNGAVNTTIDTDSTEDYGAAFTLCLKMEGSTISALIDDVVKVSGTNSEYGAAGYVGMFGGASAGGTDLRLDNFTYAAIVAAASTRRPITPIIMNYIEPEGLSIMDSIKRVFLPLWTD